MMDRNCLTDSIIGYDAIWEFNYDANILERLKKNLVVTAKFKWDFLRADRIVLNGGILLLIELVLTDISAVGGFNLSAPERKF